MKKTKILTIQDSEITLVSHKEQEYISLTDMAKKFGSLSLIEQWLRNKNTLEFIGVWESLFNPAFNSFEFEGIKNQAGFNRFSISVQKWIELTNAIGIVAKAGRYGGTYAHKDIALEFGAWLDPVFKLYIIKEFERLKSLEAKAVEQQWQLKRNLAKLNYRLHTDAIKRNRIIESMANNQKQVVYATEADMLNHIVFGCSASQWKLRNPTLEGNMRDHADHLELLILSNLESINSSLIDEHISIDDRFLKLTAIAERQLQAFTPIIVEKTFDN